MTIAAMDSLPMVEFPGTEFREKSEGGACPTSLFFSEACGEASCWRIQPVDAIDRWGLSYHLGCAVRHAARAGRTHREGGRLPQGQGADGKDSWDDARAEDASVKDANVKDANVGNANVGDVNPEDANAENACALGIQFSGASGGDKPVGDRLVGDAGLCDSALSDVLMDLKIAEGHLAREMHNAQMRLTRPEGLLVFPPSQKPLKGGRFQSFPTVLEAISKDWGLSPGLKEVLFYMGAFQKLLYRFPRGRIICLKQALKHVRDCRKAFEDGPPKN